MHDYKNVAIYYDAEKRLIGVPCGNPKVYDNHYSLLDIFFVLEPGYSDKELGAFINKLFDACFTKEAPSDEATAIQKYTSAKDYKDAVKGYQIVEVEWKKDKGFRFIPMQVNNELGGIATDIKGVSVQARCYNKFVPIPNESIVLAFKTALEIIAGQETGEIFS